MNSQDQNPGSSDSGREVEIQAKRSYMMFLFTLTALGLLLLFSAYTAAIFRKPENLVLAVAGSTPLLIPFSIVFISCARLLFGGGPIIVVDGDSVRLSKTGLVFRREEVERIYDAGISLVVDMKEKHGERLRANLLFPVIFATRSRVMIALIFTAGGAEYNGRVLQDALAPSSNTER